MLELKNITKTYKTKNSSQNALDEASLSFRRNEFVSILGVSGFDVISLSDIKSDVNLTGTWAYTPAGESSIKFLLVKENYGGVDSTFAVINSSLDTFNVADDKVLQLKGFAKGAEFMALTNDRTVEATLDAEFSAPGFANKAAIVVYELTTDSNGVVTDAAQTTGTIANPTGLITDKDGSYLIEVAGVWRVVDPEAVVYDYNITDDEFTLAKITDIKEARGPVAASDVTLYQMDSDSEVYDFIVICTP